MLGNPLAFNDKLAQKPTYVPFYLDANGAGMVMAMVQPILYNKTKVVIKYEALETFYNKKLHKKLWLLQLQKT